MRLVKYSSHVDSRSVSIKDNVRVLGITLKYPL